METLGLHKSMAVEEAASHYSRLSNTWINKRAISA